MPPRGGPGRGGARGGPVARGAAPRGRGGAASASAPQISQHISTIGVRRPGFGNSGVQFPIHVNAFATTVPDDIIYHYDVISPSEKTLPARLNMALITALQTTAAPGVFSRRAVYDGRKNMFSIFELPLGDTDSKEFEVPYSESNEPSPRGPKIYKIRLTKVATINPEVLHRFIQGNQSHDNAVLTAITALNVVVRNEPTLRYPFNIRSFFTDMETKDIGAGLVLWRGYFQSVRPAIGKMIINIDISTGAMYKAGSLIDLCLSFFGKEHETPKNPNRLSRKHGLPEREILRLQRFLAGIRVLTTNKRPGDRSATKTPRIVRKLTKAGADELTFEMREGGKMTVAQYFARTQNRPLQYPSVLCVEVGNGALIPLELCEVPPGQFMRRQVPQEKIKDVLTFATKKPQDRLASIKNGLRILQYGQSEYVRSFGMRVDDQDAMRIQARVLTPPKLRYGPKSRQPTIMPDNGAWNMVDKKFYQPATVNNYVVVIYERSNRFQEKAAKDMADGLAEGCRAVGITFPAKPVVIKYANAQGVVATDLLAAGKECAAKTGKGPDLVVVVLPENGNEIYSAVKHFGDVTMGVATQCMKSNKCFNAKPQYYANVCLKINVKLGGINLIPDPSSVPMLTDPGQPTIVMGADVIHPAPGAEGRPSFTALVANVDSNNSKYIATTKVQASRQEMITDLQSMAKHVLTSFMAYRLQVEKLAEGKCPPKRIIFYRDGVSEGQFQQVLDQELASIQKACSELNINPKITMIVVGKRHHIRFFPQVPGSGDKSGNCKAGTVVDTDISHPTEFDFYLQSHGGLLGTSRPSHYSVLYDENNFTADALQNLSFALCHVYARSTRSVSIPAPVYYADIVCSRAKNHFDPSQHFSMENSSISDGPGNPEALEDFQRKFKDLHQRQKTLMYFS